MSKVILATKAQIDQIRNLNSKYLINHLTNTQKKEGFIRVEYSLLELEEIVNHEEIVVAFDNNTIAGYYLIGRKSENLGIGYQMSKSRHLAEKRNIPYDKIGYGCQVCIDEKYRNNGLFTSMLKRLCATVKMKYDYLFCSVSGSNTISLNAHINNGWQQIDSFENTNFLLYKIDHKITK